MWKLFLIVLRKKLLIFWAILRPEPLATRLLIKRCITIEATKAETLSLTGRTVSFIPVLRDFHTYKYNEEENKRLSSNLEQDEQEMNQLAENVIVDNIGLPIVVAVTKVCLLCTSACL